MDICVPCAGLRQRDSERVQGRQPLRAAGYGRRDLRRQLSARLLHQPDRNHDHQRIVCPKPCSNIDSVNYISLYSVKVDINDPVNNYNCVEDTQESGSIIKTNANKCT